ncbi:MAG: nucleoside kinase [Bacteroidales bacterium]|nr:nucleoside kinase [Bacteroidales bacterium]MDD2425217.1 nucleoside kinase [Bacteroidales bacterium]MDD3989926.1 nucleoside kinase [Bacteroidales bacterium]MDD4639000.1 nucleoside kinase [Bacteroidales bacterium]
MKEEINVYCDNLNCSFGCKPGTTLSELLSRSGYKPELPVLAAIVDNQLKELSFKIYIPHIVRFIDYTHSDGQRCYNRSIIFVLQKVAAELFPQYSLIIDYNMQNGMYGELRELEPEEDGSPKVVNLSEKEIDAIRNRMQQIIDADLPFTREKIPTGEAVEIFKSQNKPEKATLHKLRGRFFTTVYYLDGYADHFYGPLTESTAALKSFRFESFSRGFLINTPPITKPYEIVKVPYQYKLFDVFKENSDWCSILGVKGVGALNQAILNERSVELIQIAEGLHERKYAAIADEIFKRREGVKLILISGPSSSGKTTTSKRVALQSRVLGLNPVIIEMDNYFKDREETPRDKDGNYDFEVLGALDADFLNHQLNQLFEGERVELPKFDFATGKRVMRGDTLKLGEKDILIMEGIHALNPRLTEHLSPQKCYRIYASALTSLSLDENNNISTSDNRLIRRLVRDGHYRGISPEATILRWPSVRRGEINNIFPFQENADIMFNSALIYELPVLKYFAEPMLRRIPPDSPASTESIRLLKFLSYINEMQPSEFERIPPTSVLREFIGGSSFSY